MFILFSLLTISFEFFGLSKFVQATSGTLGFIGLSTWALVAIGGSNVIGFLTLFEKELKSPVEFWLILLGPWKLP